MHNLYLYIDDCETDCKVLKITDISQYDANLPIEDPTIKIIIPGVSCEFFPPFAIRSDNYYGAKTFGLAQESSVPLPDGLYDITYSVCPNETIFTKVRHLRVCQTRARIYGYLSPLLTNCNNAMVKDGYGADITNKRIVDLKGLLTILEGAQQDAKNFKYNDALNKVNYINSILNTY